MVLYYAEVVAGELYTLTTCNLQGLFSLPSHPVLAIAF